MPLGIDLNAISMRIATQREDSWNCKAHYGVQGIPPRWNEPIVWDDHYTVRTSSTIQPISIMDAWWNFNHDYRASVQYQKPTEEEPITNPAVDLIIEAMAANLPDRASEFVVFTVDNLMPEFQQTALLRTMSQFGFGRRELLWRPIALLLAHLRSFDQLPYGEGSKIVVVDTDSCLPEITLLTLKEKRGYLIPSRNYPLDKRPAQSEPYEGLSTFNIVDHFFISTFADEEVLLNQLRSGQATPSMLKFLDTGRANDMWVRKGLDHKKVIPKDIWRSRFADTSLNGDDFEVVRFEAERIQQESGADKILFNGLLSRLNKSILEDSSVLPPNAAAIGAVEYGRRRIEGIPGYLDNLPGLEVLSRHEAQGTYDYHDVIPADEVEGGETVRIPEPLTQFSLEEGIDTFNVILHNIAEDNYKKYDTQLPDIERDGHIPLVLRAEAKPGQGHAKVTIEGAEGFEDVFGEQQQIELDWESGTDFEPTTYSGPEVYPVRGRIADDPECLSVARQFVDNDLYVGSQVQYRNRNVGYMRVHEPWGYNDPFGNRLGEPTRALFGAMHEDDAEIWELARAIGGKIQSYVSNTRNRHKYLNYMFRFAPEDFREELREIYSSKNPDLNWNTVYAVGRTFYRRDDFELFLDFFLEKSQSKGFPNYPDKDFIPAYFWAFFRALCYYEDTASVKRTKVEGVLESIYKYSLHCSNTHWPRGRNSNLIKYLLCGILFSLRLRKHHRDFLKLNSTSYRLMKKTTIDLIPRIPYPPTMFETEQPDMLNDYVLRFLDEQQTIEDMTALQGLVIAMN